MKYKTNEVLMDLLIEAPAEYKEFDLYCLHEDLGWVWVGSVSAAYDHYFLEKCFEVDEERQSIYLNKIIKIEKEF